MAGLNLLAAASEAGLEFWAEGEHLVVRGPKRAAALAEKLIQNKAQILPFVRENPSSVDDDTANIDWFQNISESDRRELLGPRNYPCRPCRHCARWIEHHRDCPMLWNDDLTTLQQGKHNGQPLRMVPTRYLRWLIRKSVVRGETLKTEIERILNHVRRGTDPFPRINSQDHETG